MTRPWIMMGALLGVVTLLLLAVSATVYLRRHLMPSRKKESKREKQVSLRCFSNENARLSYLEHDRQGSYTEATSRSTLEAISMGMRTDRNSFGLEVVQPLDIEHLSRRPSTSSCNVYLDILGEPTIYVNQNESSPRNAGWIENANSDIIPNENNTNIASSQRSSCFVEQYVTMNRSERAYDVDTNADSDDASTDYDDAWCTLPTIAATASRKLECAFCEENVAKKTVHKRDSSASKVIITVPTIMVSNEAGEIIDCMFHACADTSESTLPSQDEQHIYDVIRDSDVED